MQVRLNTTGATRSKNGAEVMYEQQYNKHLGMLGNKVHHDAHGSGGGLVTSKQDCPHYLGNVLVAELV